MGGFERPDVHVVCLVGVYPRLTCLPQIATLSRVTWLVLDDDLDPVDQVTQFALYLDGGGASPNTVRAYAPRIARFLNWCHVQGLAWMNVSLPQLILYKRGLEAEPSPAGRPRTGKTVNAHITAIIEFLRFCARVGLVESTVWQRISAGAGAKGQRYYDWAWIALTAESGHHAPVGAGSSRARAARHGYPRRRH